MYSPPADIDQKYEEGFRRAAASLGLSPHLLGSRIDMRGEKAERETAQRYPDFVYFKGYLPAGGGYGFAIATGPNVSISRGHPEVSNVALRWITRVLDRPENRHLRLEQNFLSSVCNDDLKARLMTASASEPDLPHHVRELLVEAAKRLI